MSTGTGGALGKRSRLPGSRGVPGNEPIRSLTLVTKLCILLVCRPLKEADHPALGAPAVPPPGSAPPERQSSGRYRSRVGR